MATPFEQIITDIQQMQTAFDQTSCQPRVPFITYPTTGTPPVIDYNLPQNTSFTTYGHILKVIPVENFKDFTINVPENNFFNTIENMTAEQVTAIMNPYVAVAPTPPSYIFAPYSVTGGTYVAPGDFRPEPGVLAVSTSGGTNLMGSSNPITSSGLGSRKIDHSVGANPGDVAIARDRPAPVLADFSKMGLRPILMNRMSSGAPFTAFVAKPPVTVPRIAVIEEYTTSSYLGNYGAGRVVKTFTLLPGERTTITLRTYKDMMSTRDKSQNVLDSFSNSSSNELDTLIQKEQGIMTATTDSVGGGSSSFTAASDSRNSNKSFGVNGSLNLGILNIGGGYGKSVGEASTSSHGFSDSQNYNHTGARASNVNTINNALTKHVQESNAHRQINVNTSTTESVRQGEEETTVRELINFNKSRVLTFVFRQLLQEYITITSLTNLKFAYANGYAETFTVVDLDNLENMLMDLIKPDKIDETRCILLKHYCKVLNYDDDILTFIESKEITIGTCVSPACGGETETYWRVKKDLADTYTGDGIDVSIHGVILKVQKQVLQTSSVIADAMLGAGEALDCFNQKAQDADAMAAYINNMAAMQRLQNNLQVTANNQLFATQQLEMGEQQMEVITQQKTVVDDITDPVEKAAAYKKVFGSCCPTPQYTGGCGCGKCTE